MAATVLAGASPFHPAVLSVPEGDLVLLADDPAPVGLRPDERLAAVAAAVDWVPARLFRDDLFLGDWLSDGMKSADGRIASAADSAGKKPCPTKTEKIPLDSDRPSHGKTITLIIGPSAPWRRDFDCSCDILASKPLKPRNVFTFNQHSLTGTLLILSLFLLRSAACAEISSVGLLTSYLRFWRSCQAAQRARNTQAKRPSPLRECSITQLTHDGVSKTNLLSDDSNLYVTEWPSSGRVLAKYSLPTASRSLIPNTFANVQALDISPDHSALLVAPIQGVASNNQFWTLPVNSGTPHRLRELAGRDASWSADGQQLVFGKGSALYIASTSGSAEREIFKAEGAVFAPRIAADGKRIRFTIGNTAQNTTAIWEVGGDGSQPHAVLEGWQHASSACCGHWTADGRYYIFQVTENGPMAVTTLWALSDGAVANGTEPVELTRGPMSFGSASPAPDNKRIWAIGVQPAGQAVKYNAVSKEFVSLLSGVSATDIDFSSDGKWVTYVSVPEGALWKCRSDGSDRLQLTSAPERAALPHWSPDGQQIAYVSMKPGKPWKIAVVSAKGGKPENILEENRSQIDANWSADGTRIMFGYLHQETGINIRIVNLKTHEVSDVPGSNGLFSPRWSPDGRYIAALSPDFTRVMLLDDKTMKWSTWLTEPAGAVSYPAWSADSQYLYFDDLVTDEESIRRVKVGESRTERVFKLEGIERYPGPFGLWSGRTADGSWMFVRDRSTQEIYELSVVLP